MKNVPSTKLGEMYREHIQLILDKNIDALLDQYTDDCVLISSFMKKPVVYRGKAELREMWNAVRARYSELRCEVPIIVAEGDKAAAFVRVFFRKSINQRMVQFDIAGFYTLRDGKISQIREIIDTFDLVQQLLERDISAILTGRRPNPI